ncbi:MAG: MazG-like family protein, partial [Candidatus Nanohaloarchaea archaeon]|nr:MazG-like family protein [Candidatus Nanohaloarchaea archaeon]
MARQEEIDVFMREYGMDIDPAYRALDVSAELGEVAAEMLAITEYGERQIHTNENLEKEFGDLYFSLIALANKLNIDLDAAL